jgi:hypothetical protein
MSTISAGTTVGTALVNTGDTTGNLVLQTNGTTTAVTIGTNQVVTLAQALPIGSGGTGATTRQNAMDALAGSVTAGQYLRGDGIDVIMDTLKAADMTGTLAVANGGTGQTSLAANHALIGNGTSGVQAVAPGSSGNVLTSNGTTWTSAAPAAPAAPTTAQVLSATAGASVGAVGTYAFARVEPVGAANANPGDTAAGSTLRYTNAGNAITGSGLSGTWRLMGYANNFNGNGSTVYLRIS